MTKDHNLLVMISENPLLKKYGITAKPTTSENTTSNVILERIHQVLGNLARTYNIKDTYVDKDDPWSGNLSPAAFGILSTANRLNGYIMR